MENCCICIDDYLLPVIINSGTSVCHNCVDSIKYCPTTRIKITVNLLNRFVMKFLRPPPVFTICNLSESLDKIAYINKFDKINLDDPSCLIENGKFILNMDEFKLFASKCNNLDCIDTNGEQLIHHVCRINNLDIVKYLVENGANVNYANNLRCSPIHCVRFGRDGALELIKYLVEHGADIKHRAIFGRTLIHYICMQRSVTLELINYIVKELGADVNCADSNGWCPIHFTCLVNESIELIEYLLANGANPNVQTNNGRLPSDFTTNKEILQLLKKN
jgi:ankyrin repeat protein